MMRPHELPNVSARFYVNVRTHFLKRMDVSIKTIKVINFLFQMFSHVAEKQYLYMIFKEKERLF